MTITSFKTARQQHLKSGPFLDTDHFAETLTFRPANGGGLRSIVGSVIYDETLEEGEYVEEDQERLWVLVLRDESVSRGGIARPVVGDTITRANDRHPEPFSFQGQIRNESPHAWELLFARNRPAAYGQRG